MNRKEIKKKYKQTIQPMGVYRIKNLENGKIFIGSSKNLHAKANSWKFQLRGGAHVNRDLQKDFNMLGEDKFVFEIIDKLEPKEDPRYDYTKDLETLEELWLEKLSPYGDKGYNKHKAQTK